MRMSTVAVGLVSASLLVGLAVPDAEAQDKRIKLSGFDEVPVVVTGATGELRLSISQDELSIDYVLTYEGIEGGAIRAAHIHLGQQHTTGVIVVFLCTNLGDAPASATHPTPTCPASPGEVSGTLDASNVIERAAQGVGSGDLAAVIEAIKKGVAYANVHSETSQPGEIRGQFKGRH